MPRNSIIPPPPFFFDGETFCFIHKDCRFNKGAVSEYVCVNDLPLTKHTDGNYYCLFHLPTSSKDLKKFNEILKLRIDRVEQKIEEIEKLPEKERKQAKDKISFDFRYVWFPSKVSFGGYEFSADAEFESATFAGFADFTKAKFSGYAEFNEAEFLGYANFDEAEFVDFTSFYLAKLSQGINFSNVKFLGRATFRRVEFLNNVRFTSSVFSSSANFSSVKFIDDVDFSNAVFKEESKIYFYNTSFFGSVDFNGAYCKGYIRFQGVKDNHLFIGENSWLFWTDTDMEEVRRISFMSVRLRPVWFVNTDARKFIFHDVNWVYNKQTLLPNTEETKELEIRQLSGRPYRILAIAYRQLAVNAEENNDYEQASNFRLKANELKRLEGYFFNFFNLHWWYWNSSYYGESWRRAIYVLFFLLFTFALIYTQIYFQVCPINKPLTQSLSENLCQIKTLDFWDAVLHSLTTATFQTIEHRKPVTRWGEFFTLLEKITVPIQAALLALAIRRKFMR